MRIALNALYVGGGVAGGKVYRDGLLRGLAAVGDPQFSFDVFTRRTPDLPPALPHSIRSRPAPVPDASTARRTWWEYLRLPAVVRGGGYAVYHALGSLTPRVRGVPVVLTVHDLIYRQFPSSVPLGYRAFMHAVQPRVARRADRVIVDSMFVGGEVEELLGVKPERVRVVPLGPGHGFAPVTDVAEINRVLTRLCIRPPFVLAVGRGYPHKNVSGLLRAFELLSRTHPDVRLVLIGDRYLTADPLARLVDELALTDRVTWTGFLLTDELNAVYSAAAAFAFSSLSEGFGLPVLEAMACGCPVVASNRTAIPEVVGNAGLLVDPESADEFAAALRRVIEDGALRAGLRVKGFERVRQFSWEKCASETLAVYRELLG